MRLAAALAVAAMILPAAADSVRPPEAKRVPRVLEAFGDRRVDDYAWMRGADDPAVIAHLKAENAYTDAMLAPLAPLRETLYGEMLARIRQTDESVPWRKGGWWYYTREVEGKQYPIYCRRRGTMAAAEEVMLDVNALAEGRAYTGVDFWEVSPDGRYLAYGVDFTGHRDYEVFVKDLATGALLADRLAGVDDIAWAADNRTLFYTAQNEAKRPDRLLRHRLGEAKDTLVWQEKDERFNLSVESTRSEAWILAVSASKDTSETRVIAADRPDEAPRRVAGRRQGHEYYLDHRGDEFWIRTNDRGPNFRLVRAPVADPSPARWKQVVAHRKSVMLEDTDLFADFRVDAERWDGIVRLRITDFASGEQHAIAMPEAVHSAWGGANAEFVADRYRFTYESYVTPRSVYEYAPATRDRLLLKRQAVLREFRPEDYDSAMRFAKAKDGTAIPVSLVWRKDRRGTGPRPMLLYGYGAYGHALDPDFRSTRLSLLDRGAIYAVAHVRGGGERGRLWYDAGKLARKENSFTDFIAVAERLVAEGWTSPSRLVIQGESAGGLLVGAVANLRPDLFAGVAMGVPFVDVLTTMQDPSLPLTTLEYDEWGDPGKPAAYKRIRRYSPYDNLAAKAYPPMLVEASLHDSQVPYWEAAKYVAKLRSVKTDANPVLLRTTMDAGHGGASGRYDALREIAFTTAWILDRLGLAK